MLLLLITESSRMCTHFCFLVEARLTINAAMHEIDVCVQKIKNKEAILALRNSFMCVKFKLYICKIQYK